MNFQRRAVTFFLANGEFYLKYMKVMREELSRRSHHIFIKNKEDFIKYLEVSKEEFSRKCHLVYPVKVKEFSRNSIMKEILLLFKNFEFKYSDCAISFVFFLEALFREEASNRTYLVVERLKPHGCSQFTGELYYILYSI